MKIRWRRKEEMTHGIKESRTRETRRKVIG